ncbi:hypothetical protein CRM22_003077 [Opisthorchis felineus]|uniref:Uncharacterized protein n=1 Tax=Opisthorchis felineus TaxID=147828 RepID=A0A4S2M975_OPIFE|nr:hypothetical protein CRM22_003077 [Opisthorchis felineus]
MEGCVERTPYVSLIALVLTFTGSGLMCGTNYEALRRTDIVFTENFYPVNSPQILQIIGIVYSVVTMLFSIVNFATGTCATGKTRERVYAHKKAQSNGRNYSRFLLVTNYFVTLTWILLFVAFAVPVGLWAMLHTICREETEYWRNISADKDETLFTYTFNLTHYGLYRRPIDTSLYSESINSPSVFTHLCQEISTVGPLFTIALFASFLVLIGLNCFVACLSSSAVRLDFSSDVNQMRRFQKPTAEAGGSDEYPLHPLMSQPAFLPNSSIDTQSNTFAYNDTASTLFPSAILSDGTLQQEHPRRQPFVSQIGRN